MNSTRTLALVFVALLTASIVGPSLAGAQSDLFVQGQPDLNVDVPDNTVVPGQTSELTLSINNDGRIIRGSPEARDIVTSARNVRVKAEVDEDSPLKIETGRQAIGTVTEDEPRPAPVEVTVPEGTEPGMYDVDVELKYRHTSQLYQRTGVTNERSRTTTETIEVEVDNSPRFEISNVSTDVQIGDQGIMEATLKNTGAQTATDVRLTLGAKARPQAQSMLTVGAGQSDYTRAGTLAPGEQTVVRYDIAVAEDASVREFAVEGNVQYTDTDGVEGSYQGLSAGVEPVGEQRFSFEDIESTLRVSEEGDIHGTVVNEGPTTANSVVVQFADESATVVPLENSVAVGTLEPGEGAEFRLPLEITGEAEALSKVFDMAVTYRNKDDESREFNDIYISADVASQRDEFLLDVEDRELSAGSSELVEVTVTNNLDESITDVEAKLFTDSPIVGEDDEGYVESLEAGETTTVTFEVSAESGATPRTYPLQMDFRYDDESGTSKISDTYRTAIDVTPAEDGGIPWLLVVGVLVIAAAGGVFYWRRD